MVGFRPENIELGVRAPGTDVRGQHRTRTFLGDLNGYDVRVGDVNLKIKSI